MTIAAAAARAAGGDFNEGLDAYLVGNYPKALGIWAPLAESGDEVAAFNMGVLYAQGLGVEADPIRAARWYKQSAESGYAPAQFNLGSAYMQGVGVTTDKKLAAQWWEKAAAQDYSHALFNLATLYLRGDGVQKDEDRARALYRRASALGDLRAQRVLEQIVLTASTRPAGASTAAKSQGVTARKSGPPAASQPPPDPPDAAARTGGSEPVAQQASPAAKRAQVSPTAAIDTAVTANGEDWLRRQEPGNYTIQVFAFSDQKSAQRFARERGLEDELVIVRATTKGRIWYKAFHGSYGELTQAKAARDGLRRRLGKHVPWIRRIQDVSDELAGPRETARREETVAATKSAGQSGDRNASPPRTPPASTQKAGPPPVAEKSAATSPVEKNTVPAVPPGDHSPAPAAAGPAVATDSVALQTEPALLAEAGDQQQLRRGQSFFNKQDYVNALALWRPLAVKGIPQAQYGLGFMYESGWGVTKDYEQAFMWYEKAARQGHAKSQYNLGMLFHNGLGVKRSEAKAFFWIHNAADGGDPRANEYIQQATSN